ncbi:MAG: B12-binding domain-containing radical SAM protein [Verrucomicrobia subdivision 3 bacterium]|nr:B12-binding domain-containing radical SAM protein [Verrucomicrobiota bacterium]MCC6821879.1 B12-binding domain-containing radical SAM protein [Limisphaerales bacterium]
MNVLLVSPQTPDTFWSFKHVLRFVSKKSTFPPLGLLTVAAMLPRAWALKVVDLNVARLREDDLRRADVVMLSAMLVHEASVREVVARCAALGKRVVAGGPLFTTGHEAFPEIQHFVLGEAEELMPQLVADLESGRLQTIYQAANRPRMALSPVPRWELVDLKQYVTMAVQFSRGCPFDCEFCDIIVMNGRVPRTKSPAQVIAELEILRTRGWQDMVFIVDDNFIGNKTRTRELLHEMIAWRRRTQPKMGFFTEASVNLADDAELRALMVAAGFTKVFVGIETPAAESLVECRKVQNQGRDLLAAVQTLQRDGLQVMGGFIVGFDSDQPDIFKRQFEFIQRSGVVTAMVGLLSALPQTRLYQRLKREGRLEAKSTGNNTDATLNFQPKLSREFLQSGYRELMKKLYEPGAYYQRIRTFMKNHRPTGPSLRLSRADLQAFVKSFWLLGVWHRGRVAYWRFFWSTLLRRPRQFRYGMELAIVGHHFRRVAQRL